MSDKINILFKEGELVEFRWTNKSKWKQGRIKKIEPEGKWKSIYAVEEFTKVRKIDWKGVVEGIDRGAERNFIDMQGENWWYEDMDWVFVKWFSKDYIRKLNNDTTAQESDTTKNP